jgi:hypothetical protein
MSFFIFMFGLVVWVGNELAHRADERPHGDRIGMGQLIDRP